MPSGRKLRESQLKIDDPMIVSALDKHVMREEPVRSFRFHGVSLTKNIAHARQGDYPFAKQLPPVEACAMHYTSTYAFTITWTPGNITLVGDLGEMALVHYHAALTFKDAMRWIDRSDYDYLMGKASPRKMVFDWRSTFDYVMEEANREAAGWFRNIRENRARFRAELAAAKEAGEPEEEWPVTADYELFMPKMSIRPDKPYDHRDHFIAPDGWEIWLGLWNRYGSGDPEYIYRAETRRELREDFMNSLQDVGQEGAANILYDIGVQDYYGSETYEPGTVWKIAAFKFAARRLIEAGIA